MTNTCTHTVQRERERESARFSESFQNGVPVIAGSTHKYELLTQDKICEMKNDVA